MTDLSKLRTFSRPDTGTAWCREVERLLGVLLESYEPPQEGEVLGLPGAELPAVLLEVHGDTFEASGETSDGIAWSIYAEAELADAARCRINVDGVQVAEISVHYGNHGLVQETQEVCAALVWSAVRAVRSKTIASSTGFSPPLVPEEPENSVVPSCGEIGAPSGVPGAGTPPPDGVRLSNEEWVSGEHEVDGQLILSFIDDEGNESDLRSIGLGKFELRFPFMGEPLAQWDAGYEYGAGILTEEAEAWLVKQWGGFVPEPAEETDEAESIFGTPPHLIPEGAEEFLSEGMRALRFRDGQHAVCEVRSCGEVYHIRWPELENDSWARGSYSLSNLDIAQHIEPAHPWLRYHLAHFNAPPTTESAGEDAMEMLREAFVRNGFEASKVCFNDMQMRQIIDAFQRERDERAIRAADVATNHAREVEGLRAELSSANQRTKAESAARAEWVKKAAELESQLEGAESVASGLGKKLERLEGADGRLAEVNTALSQSIARVAELEAQLAAKSERAPDSSPDTVAEELTHGGPWLGAARKWAQWNVPKGDTLEWGSGERVSIPFASLWDLAQTVAEAAIREERKARARETLDIKDRWALEQKVERLEAQLKEAGEREPVVSGHLEAAAVCCANGDHEFEVTHLNDDFSVRACSRCHMRLKTYREPIESVKLVARMQSEAEQKVVELTAERDTLRKERDEARADAEKLLANELHWRKRTAEALECPFCDGSGDCSYCDDNEVPSGESQPECMETLRTRAETAESQIDDMRGRFEGLRSALEAILVARSSNSRVTPTHLIGEILETHPPLQPGEETGARN